MAKLTSISEYDFRDLNFNMTTVASRSTTEPPDTNLKYYGLLFIFAVILAFIVACSACMALLVLFGCMKSFFCIRCRRRDEFTEVNP
ncbi:uncharacterized protein LOC6530545 [Drosophila yakuba]|uniref:Uncharacterized protein, isoform D n=1 Tax=Drosophila yakuba TaxID=7245 RepID=A0A0R1DR35_DROYA|nr:uncharacterized protein LOC6530545 [Drosophila yakuba]KRJ99687.1 uncharacterized protein Dyak_GE13666, isoform D [Drosophila yakuba]